MSLLICSKRISIQSNISLNSSEESEIASAAAANEDDAPASLLFTSYDAQPPSPSNV